MSYAYLPEHVMEAWPDLSPKAKAVAGALATFMDGEGECYPGRKKLAEASGINRLQTITEATKELREKGLITKGYWEGGNSRLYKWKQDGRESGEEDGEDHTESVTSGTTESVGNDPTDNAPLSSTSEVNQITSYLNEILAEMKSDPHREDDSPIKGAIKEKLNNGYETKQDLRDLLVECSLIFGPLPGEDVVHWLTTYEKSWVKEALVTVREQDKTVPPRYVTGILENWRKQGLSTDLNTNMDAVSDFDPRLY